jgi:hypothetical protein
LTFKELYGVIPQQIENEKYKNAAEVGFERHYITEDRKSKIN